MQIYITVLIDAQHADATADTHHKVVFFFIQINWNIERWIISVSTFVAWYLCELNDFLPITSIDRRVNWSNRYEYDLIVIVMQTRRGTYFPCREQYICIICRITEKKKMKITIDLFDMEDDESV